MGGFFLVTGVVGVVGAFVALISHANKKAKARRRKWNTAAQRLGLTFNDGPHSQRKIHARHYYPQMFGQREGQDVYVGVRSYTTGSGKNQTTHYYTFVDVIFDTPLKCGINIRRAGGISKFFGSVFGERDIQIGIPSFDRDFRVDGINPDQLVRLVQPIEARGLLSADHANGFMVSLSDSVVRLEASGIVVDHTILDPPITAAVALYRAVHEAWRALPPSPEELRITPSWQEAANRWGLSFDARSMTLLGNVDAIAVRCEVVLEGESYSTMMSASFEPPLGVDLELKTQSALSTITKVFGSQDIEVGDHLFDKKYVVKGKDPERVKQIFSSTAREGIIMLDDVSAKLEVNDDLVTIELLGTNANAEELVRVLTDTVKAMVMFRKPTSVGPFR